MDSFRLSWPQMAPDTAHGYGSVSKHLREAMLATGAVTICDHYDSDWDAVVMCSTPVPWILPRNGRRQDVVMHTMYEATPPPPDWVSILNRAGVLWTPSMWCQTMFEMSGINVPIMVSGYGVDTSVFSYVPRKESDVFRVCIWGDFLYSRKNILKALDVFLAANIPDSVVEVKLSGLCSHNDCPPGVLDYTHTDGKQHKNITICVGIWDTPQLVSWLQNGNVGLYLSSGEGFGLMPLQMMATGLPLICAYNTGMMEYLTQETAWCVPCRPVQTHLYEHPAWNYEPDWDTAVEMLRYAAYPSQEQHERGKRAADHAATFTWERAAHTAIEGLRRHYGRTYTCARPHTSILQRSLWAQSGGMPGR